MPNTTHPVRLVTTTREQYLRKEENRIRSEAVALCQSDPLIAKLLSAISKAEEFYEHHDVTAIRQDRIDATALSNYHRRLTSAAWELKLYFLDQLAVIVL